MNKPTRILVQVPMYVDLLPSFEDSPLCRPGQIVADASFLNNDNQPVRALIVEHSNGDIAFETRGMGIVVVKMSDLTHRMMHVLCQDAKPCFGCHDDARA